MDTQSLDNLPKITQLKQESTELSGTQLSARCRTGRFCFEVKGWREVGEGDSVTLIPRLVVDLVCCEAEGDRGGMQGGVGHASTSQPPAPNGVNVVGPLFCCN